MELNYTYGEKRSLQKVRTKKTKQKTSVQMCKVNVPKLFISIKKIFKLDLCFLDIEFL